MTSIQHKAKFCSLSLPQTFTVTSKWKISSLCSRRICYSWGIFFQIWWGPWAIFTLRLLIFLSLFPDHKNSQPAHTKFWWYAVKREKTLVSSIQILTSDSLWSILLITNFRDYVSLGTGLFSSLFIFIIENIKSHIKLLLSFYNCKRTAI